MRITPLFLLLAIISLVSCHKNCPDPSPSTGHDTLVFTRTLGTETNSGFLYETNPSTAYPSYPEMFVGTWTHGSGFVKHRFIFSPDLSSIPQNATIDSAFVTFYGTDNATSGNVSSGQYNNYGDNSFFLERITSTWDKTNVAWNSQPSTTATNRIAVANLGDGNGGSGKISILPLVKDLVANPSSSYGIMLKLQDEATASYRRVLFASNNHSNVSLHPVLKIVYRKN